MKQVNSYPIKKLIPERIYFAFHDSPHKYQSINRVIATKFPQLNYMNYSFMATIDKHTSNPEERLKLSNCS